MRNKSYPLYKLPDVTDLKDMVRRRAENSPNETAFSFSSGRNKIESKTCLEFHDDINAIGTFLHKEDLKKVHIAIIGENSYEWLVAFLAITNGGNVAVPIDKEQSAKKVTELLKQSNCKAVFVSKNYLDLVDNLEDIVVFPMSNFAEYISSGQQMLNNGKTEYLNYIVDPDAFAAIFFTSGTTGDCKGVMLSQRNIIFSMCGTRKNADINGCVLSVLPYSHTFGLITGVFSVYCFGCPVYINKSLKQLLNDIQKSKPSAVAFVPLFVETFYKNIMETAKKNKKDKLLAFMVCISDFLLMLGVDIRRILFKSVLQAFGGNLKYISCGGAPLDKKYMKTYRSWGISILNGYGITECSPVVSVTRNFYWRDGSVGHVIDDCDIKIADDNEILVKGENVMLGYYNDEISTKTVLNDGWYSTGDLGYLDKDGFLFITGRKKNLIILSNGENISPEELEILILNDEGVSEVVVYGDNNMLVAEIFPAEAYIGKHEYFENLIAQINQKQPQYKQIHKVIIRENEFEKNSTKKILRYKIKEYSHD